MEQIIKMITDKTGISEAQAKQAIETILGFLNNKLPAGMATQVENVLKGGDMSGMADGLKISWAECLVNKFLCLGLLIQPLIF